MPMHPLYTVNIMPKTPRHIFLMIRLTMTTGQIWHQLEAFVVTVGWMALRFLRWSELQQRILDGNGENRQILSIEVVLQCKVG